MTKAEKQEAQDKLREIFASPGIGTEGRWDGADYVQVPMVRVIFRHVNKDGTSRVLMPLIIKNGEILHIGHLVAKAVGWRYSNAHDGVICHGAGLDMAHHLVSTLAVELYGHENHGADRLAYRWLS